MSDKTDTADVLVIGAGVGSGAEAGMAVGEEVGSAMGVDATILT